MSGLITWVNNIPFATHNPSADQPNMLNNNNNNVSMWDVDHIPFNVNFSGQHKQVTFNNFFVPGSQTTPVSVEYTNSTSSTPNGQLFWRNQDSIYHISPIRAWGFFSPTGISLSQTFNIASIVRNSAGNYTITLNANITTIGNYGVVVSSERAVTGPVAINYIITDATHFDIRVTSVTAGTATDPPTVTFQVMQL